MSRTFTTSIKTKVDENSAAVTTTVTVVQDISDEDMFKVWAMKSALIAVQRRFRDAKAIPAAYTVNLSDLAKRAEKVRIVTEQSVAADLAKLTPDVIKRLLAESVAREEAEELARMEAEEQKVA